MTTDITELALLVSKAKASVFTLEYISQFEPADIDSDDVDLRFEVDGRDTGTNVSIVDECGQAARVIGALVEALEKAQAKATQQGNIACALFDEVTQLRRHADEKAPELRAQLIEADSELEALRQRIAELESFRTAYMEWSDKTDWVRTDRRFDVVKPLGKHLADVLKAYIEHLESRTVKLPPKIEHVDTDVSDRNQPGMVVAVHIDVGDFVKFRDQVYEVKETDFDDHDVTLWFVGGEALKCAAGCQIEVVSAPEEAE